MLPNVTEGELTFPQTGDEAGPRVRSHVAEKLHEGAIMQARFTMAPWMRRRIARYLQRGTSERMIACLVGPFPSGTEPVKDPGPPDWRDAQVDLSNVILFRALSGGEARGHARAQ
jgi:hypothetical protein